MKGKFVFPAFRGPEPMIRTRLTALLLLVAAAFHSFSVVADPAEPSIPDPERAWEHRDFEAVERWLESVPPDAADSAAALRARAWLARRDGDTGLALDLVGRAIAQAPDSADLRVDRAAFRSDLIEDAGRFRSLRLAREIRDDLEHAVSAAPGHVDALVALASFHQRAPGIAGGDAGRVTELMERLGEIAPFRLHLRDAMQFAEDERYEQAVSEITLAIDYADQARPKWHLRKGEWLRRLGRDRDALAAFEQALALAPRFAPVLFEIGRLAAESGLAVDTGTDALRRYLELPRWSNDPDAKLAWWHLGRLHADSGRNDQAERAFARALELDPDWSRARQALEALPANGSREAE